MQAKGGGNSKSLLMIGVGTVLASMVIAGFMLGYGVDVWLGTQPVFTLLFAGLGLVGGFLRAYQLLMKFG